jgi:hypothetical protein
MQLVAAALWFFKSTVGSKQQVDLLVADMRVLRHGPVVPTLHSAPK